MKHARSDYDRFQDPAGLIPDDEPVFLLRGQDKLAPGVVRAWADRASLAGDVDFALVTAVRRHADAMEHWQATRGFKTPDAPADVLEVSA